MESSQQDSQQSSMGSEPGGYQQPLHCYWHPAVETGLSCGRCGKSICTGCMVQAPVGIRCRDCGMTAPIPTFEVPPTYYARAVGAGVACAIGGGLLWFVANIIFARIPFLPSLVAIGIGYGTGELISLAVNRKRGTGLAVIAGASVLMALLIGWQLLGARLDIWRLLFLAFGVYAAVQRVR